MRITITEALAEKRLIKAKIEKKTMFVTQYHLGSEGRTDPLAKQGGSDKLLPHELDSIRDLWNRYTLIVAAIQKVNSETTLTVNDITDTVARWLIWKREVYEPYSRFFLSLQQRAAVNRGQRNKDSETIISYLDERIIQGILERMVDTFGKLDGALTLLNSTTFIELPD